jgi:hypothetical protein
MWERQAEDNAVERLQKIGLLAPPGEVDKDPAHRGQQSCW